MPTRRERQMKDETRARKKQQRTMLLVGGGVLAVVVVAGIVALAAGVFSPPTPVTQAAQITSVPGTCDPIQTFPVLSRDHINPGETHPPYNSNPPTNGWHWPNPQDWGIYTAQQFQEQLVHNLEHGGIVVQYNGLTPVDVQRITDFVQHDSYHMILAPYPGLPTGVNVALTAWSHLLTCNGVNESAMSSFVNAYRDQGPEKVP